MEHLAAMRSDRAQTPIGIQKLGLFLILTFGTISAPIPLAAAPPSELNTTVLPRLGEAPTATTGDNNALIFPDGSGLPEGEGSVAEGMKLYTQHCLLCHGPNARGGSGEELSGGIDDLSRDPPDQTIGTYWPFATTLYDFIRRAMPMHIPGMLNNNEVYALAAYLLFENGVIPENTVLDRTTLAKVKMPNRDGFMWIDITQDGKLDVKSDQP